MSKERATPVDRRLVAMQERIEELEREIERKMSAAAFILKERDALQADNAELVATLEQAAEEIRRCDYTPARSTLLVALAKVRKP